MSDDHGGAGLPPGFHFHPTDEELILNFLYPKTLRSASLHPIIPDLRSLRHLLPWELHGKAMASGNQWYFFSRPVRGGPETREGCWKRRDAAEEPVFAGGGVQIGVKTVHVFTAGGVATAWVMHEYRLCNPDAFAGEGNSEWRRWAVCRVYEEDGSAANGDDREELSCLDEIFLAGDGDFDEITLPDWQ